MREHETNKLTKLANNTQKNRKTHLKLSSRHLSLNESAILLNTLILAKSVYLSNAFPIPDNILTKTHKIIFQYLWQNKDIESIARKTTFSPKQKGGLRYKGTKYT